MISRTEDFLRLDVILTTLLETLFLKFSVQCRMTKQRHLHLLSTKATPKMKCRRLNLILCRAINTWAMLARMTDVSFTTFVTSNGVNRRDPCVCCFAVHELERVRLLGAGTRSCAIVVHANNKTTLPIAPPITLIAPPIQLPPHYYLACPFSSSIISIPWGIPPNNISNVISMLYTHCFGNGKVQVVLIRCLGTLGMGCHCHLIFHPFPLFLLSGRDSSIIFFQVLSPVFPFHPLTSRFVMSSHPRM